MRTGVRSKPPLVYRAVKLINRNRLILTYGTFGLAGIRPIFSIRDLSPKHSARNLFNPEEREYILLSYKQLYSRIKIRERIEKSKDIVYPINRKYIYIIIYAYHLIWFCILTLRLSYNIYITYSRILQRDKKLKWHTYI